MTISKFYAETDEKYQRDKSDHCADTKSLFSKIFLYKILNFDIIDFLKTIV